MASSPKLNLFHLQYALLSSDTRAKSSRSSSNQPRDAPRIVYFDLDPDKCYLSRTEILASHLEEETNTEFEISFDINFKIY